MFDRAFTWEYYAGDADRVYRYNIFLKSRTNRITTVGGPTDRPPARSRTRAHKSSLGGRYLKYCAVFETTHFISAACRENLRTVETAAKIGELRNLTDRRRGVGLSERCARSMRHLISGHGKRSQQFSSYNGRIHQRGLKTCKRHD